MGDEQDRSRLAAMSEKEREQEIFKRIERRDLMKTRYVMDLYMLCKYLIINIEKRRLIWMVQN